MLPARVPHLLVNGAAGIAVGIATKIPPHNLREVVAGLKALIRDPDISITQLMQHIPGPDFPTGWAQHVCLQPDLACTAFIHVHQRQGTFECWSLCSAFKRGPATAGK